MYVILVYDIGEKRVGKVCKYLRTYLPRVQNSVFEGDITLAKLEKMKAGLNKIIVPAEDSVLLWILRDPKWADRQTLGNEPNPITNIL
jgi:CRISPR-associated protein Cas2